MLRRCMKMFSLLLALALMLPGMTPARAASISARINASSVRVYASASTSSKSVTVKKGTTVTIKSVSGSWAKIAKDGVTAYVNVKYLTTTDRYLRYVSRSTGLYRSASSDSKVATLSVNTKVYVVGMQGDYYRVQDSSGSVTGYVLKSAVSKSKAATSWKEKVTRTKWFSGGDEAFPEGSVGTIYDVNTGISLRVKRMGGHSHADVEPLTKADTAKLLRISGGSWSWDSRAVILAVDGKYIACGINTMPHGDQTIDNNGFNGQFCLHMKGSMTHGTNTTNEYHQDSVDRAYNWAHS